MDSFVNLAYLAFLVFALINGIVFLSRLGASRGAWTELVQNSKPVRRLTTAERAAIRKAWNAEPLDDQVYRVSGEAKRHGIESSRGSEWHLLVGGIEVMPFPEWPLRVTDDNDLEVVRAKRKRIGLPVTFNGVGLEEALAHKAAGKGVELRLLSAEKLEEGFLRESGQGAVAGDEAPTLPPAPLAEVVERGSRLETAQDVALRQASEWHGTASAVFAMLGLLGVLFTASFDGAMQWLGLLPGALAAWCGWLLVKGWRKGPKARPVRRLRTLTGPISLSIVSVGEGAAAHVATRISMGGNVLRYPQSWSHLPLFDGDDTLHEVEVDTVGEVVRHDRLSLFEQLTRFAPVASWRSAVLAGGAGVVLLVALALGAADTTALKTGVQRLSGQDRSILADAPETLLGLDPRAGDWVRLSGTASCLQQADRTPRVTEAVLDGHAFRCPLLGWGQRQQLADAENTFAPEEIVGLTQLASGLRELAKLRNPDPYSTYARDASTGGDVAAKLYQMLSMARSAEADLNQAVLQVEKLCGEDGGVDCSILESRLVSLVRTDESWDALVGKARAGKLPTAFDFGQSDYTALADDIIAAVRPAFVRGLQKQLDAAWKEDAVSLVLDVRDAPLYVADLDGVSDHPLQRVAALDFVLSGVVKEVSKEGGRTLLQIERMDAPASTWRLFAPTLFALLALLVGAFGLSGFLRARRENLVREKGLAEWLSKMLR